MAYVIGNTITMPQGYGNWDLIGSGLAQGIGQGMQAAAQRQAFEQLRQQYNLVPQVVTDENGNLSIRWVPKIDRIAEARKALEALGIPATGWGVDAEGNIVVSGGLDDLAQAAVYGERGNQLGLLNTLKSLFSTPQANANDNPFGLLGMQENRLRQYYGEVPAEKPKIPPTASNYSPPQENKTNLKSLFRNAIRNLKPKIILRNALNEKMEMPLETYNKNKNNIKGWEPVKTYSPISAIANTVANSAKYMSPVWGPSILAKDLLQGLYNRRK